MARRHLLDKLSGSHPGLDSLWDWYDFQVTLVNHEQNRTLDAARTGTALDQPRYFAKTPAELTGFFQRQRDELGYATMMSLLAATEAAIRVDFLVRVKNNKKDPISRDFAQIYRQSGLQVGLEDQILGIWKQNSARDVKEMLGRFRGCLHLRHWLAHGRYWKPKVGQYYDAHDVFVICHSLLQLMGILMSE